MNQKSNKNKTAGKEDKGNEDGNGYETKLPRRRPSGELGEILSHPRESIFTQDTRQPSAPVPETGGTRRYNPRVFVITDLWRRQSQNCLLFLIARRQGAERRKSPRPSLAAGARWLPI